jgi:hypothetical protein
VNIGSEATPAAAVNEHGIKAVEQLPAGPTGPEGEENRMPQSGASGSSTEEACLCENRSRVPDPPEKSRVSQPLRERL